MTEHVTITLTPAARHWTLEHGSAITLRHSLRHGCCGGSARVPVAQIGEPDDPSQYRESVIDGVRVFRSPSLQVDDETPITIDLAGLWRWRRLVVTGVGIGIGITAAHEKAR